MFAFLTLQPHKFNCMGFGNFKIILGIILYLFLVCEETRAQENNNSADFLYQHLDRFLQNPSTATLEALNTAIAPIENQLQNRSDYLAWMIINTNMGYYHHQFENIPAAILYYEKAWKTYQEENYHDYDIIENCLRHLGNLYIKIGDLKKAENTIKNYLFLAEKSNNINQIISGITTLSIAYNNQGDYKNAIEILNKGLEIDSENINILTNLSTNYLSIHELKIAKELAKKVIIIDPSQVNAYQILAAISLEENKINEAESYMSKAKKKLLEHEETSARSIAKLELGYLDILISKSAYDEAKNHLKYIYASLLPKYSKKNELPEKETLIADHILLKALDVHAYLYQQTNQPLKAITAYDLAFSVHSTLNALYPLQETKILQHAQNRNRTEYYIDLLFTLYKNTNNHTFLEQSFMATEHSKAPFINEALISKKRLSQYKNDTLVGKTMQLQAELAFYDTHILKEKEKGKLAAIAQIQKWTSDYDLSTTILKETLEKLQDRYPDLLIQKQDFSMIEFQNKLKLDKLTFIEYFYGNKTVYIFIIDSNTIKVLAITNIEEFNNIIRNYITYFDDASKIMNDVPGFSESSLQAYESLKIPSTANRLLVIPDGLLSFIPFESLLTHKTDALSFSKMPFLLNSCEISYEISASKYLRSYPEKSKKTSVLGIFPVFENTNIELPYSSVESDLIAESFNGEYLKKEQATYQNFVQKAKNHTILHLSTHAEAGSFTRPASIKFRNQNILVNQLYGLHLEADMVVLSACETGIGKLAKGEGPLSIGRGFQYAGVENVLFSLWNVNDKTTTHFMGRFYQNLKKLNAKSSALYQTKLDYLNAKDISNDQKSPYNWAPFVYYGEIETSYSTSYLWSIITITLLLIILFLAIYLRKKK